MTGRRVREARGEGGWVAVEMPAAICLLLIPIACLVAVLPTWLERQSLARSASREAARTIARADNESRGRHAADTTVGEMADNAGITRTSLRPAYSGSLTRGSRITADVTVDMPIIVIPLIGPIGGFSYTAHDVEAVDQYRSLP